MAHQQWSCPGRSVLCKLVITVSCPPCWLAVLVNTLPTLPTSALLIHNPPVWSRKLRIRTQMLPKRVGGPKMIASASANFSVFATGTWARAVRAAASRGVMSLDLYTGDEILAELARPRRTLLL